jgi:trans-AT polyketide synthase/acyltransferase/oxidoreductase domain-containing protein
MSLPILGRVAPTEAAAFEAGAITSAVARFRETTHLVREPGTGRVGVAFGSPVAGDCDAGELAWLGTLPPLYPEWLGDRTFAETHGTRFPYVAGAMANGIATTTLVIAMARAGMIGFFGAAGLHPSRIEAAIAEVQGAVGGLPYGFNLIHSPQEPALEAAVVDLYLRHAVPRVSAAAYMGLTAPLVRYACAGLHRLPDGGIGRRTHVFAKISRAEVARRFLSPAPPEILQALLARGELTREQVDLAAHVPLAEDITMESDSGGHTDNRPLGSLLPTIQAVRDELVRTHGYRRPVRVGAAGGMGTPGAVAGAFAMGAAYVLLGSVNQSSVEAGVSPRAKEMLAKADVADVAMAPAADMFEMGVEVQVLKRGTLFAARGHKLRELYHRCASLDAIPADERNKLEREVFQGSLDDVWEETRAFFAERDPKQLERASSDPRHKMALLFRWYLGKSSRWAIAGDPARVLDYQLWCGPAMGAFNQWVRGSFLEAPAQRSVAQIGLNLLEGAAVVTRAAQLRTYGVAVPDTAFDFRPRPLA